MSHTGASGVRTSELAYITDILPISDLMAYLRHLQTEGYVFQHETDSNESFGLTGFGKSLADFLVSNRPKDISQVPKDWQSNLEATYKTLDEVERRVRQLAKA